MQNLSRIFAFALSLTLLGCSSGTKHQSISPDLAKGFIPKEVKKFLSAADQAKSNEKPIREISLLLSVVQNKDFKKLSQKHQASVHLRIAEINHQMEHRRYFPNTSIGVQHLKIAQQLSPDSKAVRVFRNRYPLIAKWAPQQKRSLSQSKEKLP